MSYNRFKNTFIWMAANGYKKAVRSALGLFFALLLVYSIKLGLSTRLYLGEHWEVSQMEDAWDMTLVMVMMVFILCVANYTSHIRTTDSRVMALMLPASNAEKFWAAYLWTSLSLTAMFVVAVVCADFTRVLLSYIAGWDIHGSMILTVIANGFPGKMSSDVPALAVLEMYQLMIGAHAVFVLGGALFRRQPVLFTLLAVFALSTAFGIVVSVFCTNVPSFFDWLVEHLKDLDGVMSQNAWLLILNVLTAAFTVLHFWGAYKLFCRTQIISNKWINV